MPAQIRFDYDPMNMMPTVEVRTDPYHFRMVTDHRDRYEPDERMVREYAERASREIAEQVHRDIMEAFYRMPRMRPRERDRGRMTATEIRMRQREQYARADVDFQREYMNNFVGADLADLERRVVHDEVYYERGVSTPQERPKQKKFAWMEGVPKQFEEAGIKANLLDTTTKIYDEGKTMRHCLYSYKRDSIKQGKYLPFHLDVPREINKNGVTLVFQRDPRDEKKWIKYERRGKANSKPQDPRLDAIEEALLKAVNKGDNKMLTKKNKRERMIA